MVLSTVLAVGSAARAATAPISFDPRNPFARLAVRAHVGGKSTVLYLDTGSASHVWGLELAKAAGFALGVAHQALDADARAWTRFPLAVTGELDDLWIELAPVEASAWAEQRQSDQRNGPRMEGVVSPQHLTLKGRALLLEIPNGRMTDLPWEEALFRTHQRPPTLAEVAIAADEHFYVTGRACATTTCA